MKKNRLWKGILSALLLLALGAGSVLLAWTLRNSNTPEPSPDSQGSQIITGSQSDLRSEQPDGVSGSEVSDGSESQDDTDSQTDSGAETQTESETQTETGTQTDAQPQSTTNTESTQNPGGTQDIPLSEILGQITPPPEGSSKKIAFTFDDGPYAPVTRAIADEFAKYGGRCTFFVVGNRMGNATYDSGVVKYASDLGHEIGIHAYTHTAYYNKCSESTYQYEIQTTASLIEGVTGKAPVLMRPVGGSITNPRVANSPYSVILWNVDTKDYSYSRRTQQNINRIVQNIVTATTAGDIILMHDLYFNSLEAVKIVLPALAEQGYEFVTVSELLGEEMQPGKKYNKAY